MLFVNYNLNKQKPTPPACCSGKSINHTSCPRIKFI